MQVSAINSKNFGNSYYLDLANDDIKKTEDLARAIKQYEDRYIKSSDDDETPKKKGFFGVLASVAFVAGASFLLARNGYKNISKTASEIMNSSTAQRLLEFKNKLATDTKIGQRATAVLADISQKVTGNAVTQGAKKLLDKVGITKLSRENLVAGIASIGTTTYLSTVDGNNDGVSDIAQKGINVYKNALEQAGVVKDIVSLIA